MSLTIDKDKFKIITEAPEGESLKGVVSVVYQDSDAYLSGTELTKEEIRKVNDYDAEYIKTVADASAAISTEIMEKHEGVDKVITETPFSLSARGNISTTARRSQTWNSNLGGKKTSTTRSTLTVNVKNPVSSITKKDVRSIEDRMTEKLLGKDS